MFLVKRYDGGGSSAPSRRYIYFPPCICPLCVITRLPLLFLPAIAYPDRFSCFPAAGTRRSDEKSDGSGGYLRPLRGQVGELQHMTQQSRHFLTKNDRFSKNVTASKRTAKFSSQHIQSFRGLSCGRTLRCMYRGTLVLIES